MKLSNEMTEKAKKAKSAEEIVSLAKQHGIELSEAEAEAAFARLHKEGELADDELNNVAGGCGSIDEPKYYVGQRVKFNHGSRSNRAGVIKERSYAGGQMNYNCWVYNIEYENDDGGMALNVLESNIICAM